MKKNILAKGILTTAMVAAMFGGGNKLTANAMTIEEFAKMVNTPVEEVKADPDWMACYYSGYHDDSICTYEEFMASLNDTPNNNDLGTFSNTASASTSKNFDYKRYAAENPDVVAVFGQDEKALYNHYTTYGVKEGRKAYYIDGTAIAVPGIAVLRTEMLDLVNADRAANGAAPLVWSEELANHSLTRVIEVLANYQSPEYWDAYNNGEPTGIIAHKGSIYMENALLNWSADTAVNANSRWIESEGHHDGRIYTEVTQYACASYLDPVTGQECWIEVFE